MEKLTLILIDDTAAHRTLLKRAISRAGLALEVHEAVSVADGSAKLFAADFRPALAIIDLNLGDGRGSTLIELLRANSELREIPVVALSTSALESDIAECYAAGADAYVVKGDNVQTFSQDICSAIRYLLNFAA